MTDLENREAFEDWFTSNSIHDHVYVRGERTDEKGNYYSEYAYLAWSVWQAAIAQAIPEGFVVVPKVPTQKMIDATINVPIPAVYGDSISGQHKLKVAAYYKAMIEAVQEADND